LEIRHRSVRPISAKHAQASRFLQQSRWDSSFVLRAIQGSPCGKWVEGMDMKTAARLAGAAVCAL
ncbi:hypothetical protein OII43_26855, partial [Achromobacter ruhlandii]|uniref:hypothetical protein n=1 Tax=Achromobacter ruhlandii TaxID=72557 RepID=UPI0021F1A9B7